MFAIKFPGTLKMTQIDKMHYTIAICNTMSGRSRSIFIRKSLVILENHIHFDFLLYLEF